MFKRLTTDEINSMSVDQIEERRANYDEWVEDPEINLADLESEMFDMDKRMADLKEAEEVRKRLKEDLAKRGKTIAKKGEFETVEDLTSSMEYRKAFMRTVQTGKVDPFIANMAMRADAENVSTDLGVLIPKTILQEIIQGVKDSYGTIYNKVRHFNYKGSVEIPIGEFGVSVYWEGTNGTDKEHGVSETQKGGQITGSVTIGLHLCEIRLAQSLLQVLLTVEAFEHELARAITEAWLKEQDTCIIKGSGGTQPMGILTEAAKNTGCRIPAENIIEVTEDDLLNFAWWETKFFGNIPLSMEDAYTEFVMAKQTYTLLGTMKDTTGQPIEKASYDHDHKQHTFDGYSVNRVEKALFPSFAGADNGAVFAMFWNPQKAYAVNTNMDFHIRKYFDDNTNQYVTKALAAIDGNILDPKYIYLLKKKTLTENKTS